MIFLGLAGLLLCLTPACASVDVVRLQPSLLQTPKGTEPLAGIQATCLGFYLLTLGIPEADLDKAINELLLKEAKKLGADRVINLRFEGTPAHGIWWLTKLLGFRYARASGIAVVAESGGDEKSPQGSPPALRLPPPPPAAASSQPSRPTSEGDPPPPASQPATFELH